MTKIGQLNRMITLQDLVRTPDGSGGANATWQDLAKLWAKIRPRHANETLNADGLESTATHVITIRHYPGLTPDMRFVIGARAFEILSIVDENESHCWHICKCREVLGDDV